MAASVDPKTNVQRTWAMVAGRSVQEDPSKASEKPSHVGPHNQERWPLRPGLSPPSPASCSRAGHPGGSSREASSPKPATQRSAASESLARLLRSCAEEGGTGGAPAQQRPRGVQASTQPAPASATPSPPNAPLTARGITPSSSLSNIRRTWRPAGKRTPAVATTPSEAEAAPPAMSVSPSPRVAATPQPGGSPNPSGSPRTAARTTRAGNEAGTTGRFWRSRSPSPMAQQRHHTPATTPNVTTGHSHRQASNSPPRAEEASVSRSRETSPPRLQGLGRLSPARGALSPGRRARAPSGPFRPGAFLQSRSAGQLAHAQASSSTVERVGIAGSPPTGRKWVSPSSSVAEEESTKRVWAPRTPPRSPSPERRRPTAASEHSDEMDEDPQRRARWTPGKGIEQPAVSSSSPQPALEAHDLYKLLGVDRAAEHKDIQKGFHRQCMRRHPDKGGDRTGFQELVRARMVLCDPILRKLYDEEGLGSVEKMQNSQKEAANYANMLFALLEDRGEHAQPNVWCLCFEEMKDIVDKSGSSIQVWPYGAEMLDRLASLYRKLLHAGRWESGKQSEVLVNFSQFLCSFCRRSHVAVSESSDALVRLEGLTPKGAGGDLDDAGVKAMQEAILDILGRKSALGAPPSAAAAG